MALPRFDNHDERIRYYELMLQNSLSAVLELPLPPGWHYEFYSPGDRDSWIAIERSAKELSSYEQGLQVWERYYAAHEEELPGRMVFLTNDAGEKLGTATAFYDVLGNDRSGDGWLHWVAIARPAQGLGLSKPLISHTLCLLRNLGYSRAKIPTQTNTWLACKVYLDLGFRPIPENAEKNRDGWRILRRLTDHPALAEFPPAEDELVLAQKKG